MFNSLFASRVWYLKACDYRCLCFVLFIKLPDSLQTSRSMQQYICFTLTYFIFILQMMQTKTILFPEKQFGALPGWLVELVLARVFVMGTDSSFTWSQKGFCLWMFIGSILFVQVLKLGSSSWRGVRWLHLVCMVTGLMELTTCQRPMQIRWCMLKFAILLFSLCWL